MYEIVLFLFSNNFLAYSNYLILLLMFIFLINHNFDKNLLPSFQGVVLFFAFLSFAIIYRLNYGELRLSYAMGHFITPISAFYLGGQRAKSDYRKFGKDVIVISAGAFIHSFSNIIINKGTSILKIEGRAFNDVYGGTISATLLNLYFIGICSLLFYFLFCEKNKGIKFTGTVAVILSIYGTIVSASRTLFYVTALTFATAFFIYLSSAEISPKKARIWIITFCAVAGIGIAFNFNFLGIKSALENSPLGIRMAAASEGSSIAHNDRMEYASEVLKMIPQYPFGNLNYKHYAHNFWLDVARQTGIIPALLFVLFTLMSLKNAVKLFNNKFIDTNYKCLLIPMFLAYFVVFFTEPIYEGAPLLLSCFCYISGGLKNVCGSEIRKTADGGAEI